jgi:serine O-acetyltransferase
MREEVPSQEKPAAQRWVALKADTYRQYGRFSIGRLVVGFLARRTFRVVVTLRLCQAAAGSQGLSRMLLPLLKLLHRLAAQRAGVDLFWGTPVGPGLKLTHGWGLVVSPEARIGSNVTLFHGVTLGRRDHIAKDGQRSFESPTVEDEVVCGPHAIIVGGVTIGCGSLIAGGAFVTEDVPPHSVVTGNPATIVRTCSTPYGGNLAPL